MRASELTVEYLGKTLPINGWIKELKLDISRNVIYLRIFAYNWDVKEAFYTPYKKKIRITESMIDSGVESVQLSMLARGYFRKENRIWRYKMLNTWYKEFRSENMKAA